MIDLNPFIFIESFKIELLYDQANYILQHVIKLRNIFFKPQISIETSIYEVSTKIEKLAKLLRIADAKILNQADYNELLTPVQVGRAMQLQMAGDRFRSSLDSHTALLLKNDFCSHTIRKATTNEEIPLHHSDLNIDFQIKIDGKTIEQIAGRCLVLAADYVGNSNNERVDLEHIFPDISTDLLNHFLYSKDTKRKLIEQAVRNVENGDHAPSHAFLEFIYSNLSYSVNMFLVRLWMYDALAKYVINIDDTTKEILSLLTEIYMLCDYVWYDESHAFQFMLRDPKNSPNRVNTDCIFSIYFHHDFPPLEFESVLGAWNANCFPGWILSDDHQKVAEQILKVSNVTTRDILIRYFGYELFLQNLDLDIVDTQCDYQLGLLYLVDGSDIRTLPYLIMVNPSTGERHIEGVEPRIRTVEEALNWRLGLTVYDKPVFEA